MRVGIGAAFACAALLAVAPSAHAFELENVTAAPASNQAGANADLTLSFEVSEPEADLRDLTIHLPPGLIGNPRAASMCAESELSADTCPAGSAVGTVVNDLELDLVVPIPLSVSGTVYNVVPRAGEPARFGIVLDPLPIPLPGNPLFPKIIVQSAATLRPSDLGLDTILNGLPNTATVAGIPTQINITSLSLTLDGTAPSGQGFIRLPTSCKTHNVGFDAAAYDGQTATANAQFATSNCGALPFTPELSARVKRVGAVNDPIELSTTIAQTIEEAGLRRAQVVLPAGIGGNNDVLSNQCSQADFLAETCPAASLVGFASATSPLLSEGLIGQVALVQPGAPGLPDIGIDLRGPLALKLKGTLGFTPEGRNIVVFDNLPDIPIAEFTLTFGGGPGGLVSASRDVCKPPPLTFDANFLAHSGAALDASAVPKVDCSGANDGPGGRGGSNRGKPRARIQLSKLASEQPTMRLTVKAGAEKLRRATVKLPASLRFTRGKRFDRNFDAGGAQAKHGARKLKLSSKKPAKRLRARLGSGALEADEGLRRGAHPKFKVTVRDAEGKRTKLTVRGR